MKSAPTRFATRAFLLLIAFLFSASHGFADRPQDAAKPAARPTIVFMTDFGTANDSVAICRAVILGIDPDVRIMDITHQVTPFSIEEASRFLAGVSPYYPAGTVFLVVVDPGVGTTRKAVIIKSKKGQYFVLPDNGLITPVAGRDGIEGAPPAGASEPPRAAQTPALPLGVTFTAPHSGAFHITQLK